MVPDGIIKIFLESHFLNDLVLQKIKILLNGILNYIIQQGKNARFLNKPLILFWKHIYIKRQ